MKFEPAGRPRGIVLLSDGLNNVAPDPMQDVRTIPKDVPIFAVALGPAGNTTTLQQIAGSRPGGQYFVVEGDEDIGKLHQIYASLQALAAGMPVVALTSIQANPKGEKVSVVVDDGSLEACFVLSWDGSAKELDFVATGPNGKTTREARPPRWRPAGPPTGYCGLPRHRGVRGRSRSSRGPVSLSPARSQRRCELRRP